MLDTDKAHEMLIDWLDADHSPDEVFDFLIQGGIPEEVAYEVVVDVRGAAPTSHRRKK